jgi:hypothetical protein
LTPEENVQRLIVLTEQLAERMRLDADAFEARRPHEAAARIDETQKLANIYRYESDRVRQDPSLIAAAPAALRQRLKRASETFETALERHGRAVFALKAITEGVVKAIAEEVARTRAAAQGYGPGARMATLNGAIPIALNRTA